MKKQCALIKPILLASLLCSSFMVAAQASTTVRFGLGPATDSAEVKNGAYRGFTVELVKSIAAEVDPNITVDFILAPKRRLSNELLANNIDFAFLPPSATLHAHALQIAPAWVLNVLLWSRRDQPISSLKELAGLSIGVPENYRSSTLLADSKLIVTPSTQNLLQMLIGKRVDGIISVKILFKHRLKKLGLKDSDFPHIPLEKITWYLWSHNNFPASSREAWARATDTILYGPKGHQLAQKYFDFVPDYLRLGSQQRSAAEVGNSIP